MSLRDVIDSPVSWAIAGFAIGASLGVTSTSVWLVAIGLGAFVVYLKIHGSADQSSEGRLFAAGPIFIMSWLVGFVVHGMAS